jgi:hypothetical protein
MMERYVLWLGGNCLRYYDGVKRFVKSFFPSQVIDVSHHINGISETVYQSKMPFSNWTNSFCSNMYLSCEGYYRIHVWNANVVSYQSYYLSASHLDKALGSRHLFSWWAMTDFGIITMLSSYISMMQLDKNFILGILIDGEDVTHILKPYISCMSLMKNCTARSVCSLYHELTGTDPKKMDADEVVFIDYNMVEHKRSNDEFLFE